MSLLCRIQEVCGDQNAVRAFSYTSQLHRVVIGLIHYIGLIFLTQETEVLADFLPSYDEIIIRAVCIDEGVMVFYAKELDR